MKIQVSKVFANYLNKLAKEGVLDIDHAELKTFTAGGYSLNVGDTYDAEEYGDDFIDKEGDCRYKAIVIVYKDEYYACNRYLTTCELWEQSHSRCVTNEEELREMLKDLINI